MLAYGQYTFTYDDEGNRKTKTTNGQTTTYTWDYRNRLLRITHPDGTASSMKYDFSGRRIRQTTKTGETTKYYWDNAYVLVETDENGNIRALNTIGNEIISREYRANPGDPNCVREKYYYLYDHLGTTRALTDGQGNLVQESFYDVYGKCWNVTKDSINGYQYVGGYGVSADAAADDDGLLYMRARYQDPLRGVFVSRDPVGLRGGLKLYGYVNNNPVKFVDVTGTMATAPRSIVQDLQVRFLTCVQLQTV